jgi:hypothetical protein
MKVIDTAENMMNQEFQYDEEFQLSKMVKNYESICDE